MKKQKTLKPVIPKGWRQVKRGALRRGDRCWVQYRGLGETKPRGLFLSCSVFSPGSIKPFICVIRRDQSEAKAPAKKS